MKRMGVGCVKRGVSASSWLIWIISWRSKGMSKLSSGVHFGIPWLFIGRFIGRLFWEGFGSFHYCTVAWVNCFLHAQGRRASFSSISLPGSRPHLNISYSALSHFHSWFGVYWFPLFIDFLVLVLFLPCLLFASLLSLSLLSSYIMHDVPVLFGLPPSLPIPLISLSSPFT